ncbi:juvenile hormone acid O-methyltransferase-like [Stomoxys calcitrans]|uniref:Methyltransferase type 11 domain-containing protein n=1 Tax=Stomoxys calcitrans TaxID=35570 RepID=A0A1I8PAX7_STOCA|nr:juvenile hormone acid O-methyltransferase-like [Stomoxys calcitrans]
MNNPALYKKANEVQRHDSEIIIAEYAPKMKWRYDGSDSLIDLGSGSGDVLMDFIYPRMPKNFHRLVCSDINPKMVKSASDQYGHIKGTEFRVLDMATQLNLPSDLQEQFDHVVSFYAMMWVENQRQCLKNISNLLRVNGGDCLLVQLASHPILDGYKLLSQMDKWAEYMNELDTLIPVPIQHWQQPTKDFAQLMAEVGFRDLSVNVQSKVFDYGSLETFKVNMKAVNPFLDRIPISLHKDYLDDLMSMTLKSLGWPIDNADYNIKFPVPYQLLIAFGRK